MKSETIVLGGGCFWCTEAVFNMFKGVIKTASGYAGGHTKNPTYEEVCEGETGHAEVLQIEFDPSIIPLDTVLEVFFSMHDPTTLNRQGADMGTQYRSIILYTSDSQKDTITKSIKKAQSDFSHPIVTEVKKLDKFYPAEDYHQRYYESNSSQPYCSVVITPKVKKIRDKFKL